MNEQFDEEFADLLHKHFGVNWEFSWKDVEDGFTLNLVVYGQPVEETE